MSRPTPDFAAPRAVLLIGTATVLGLTGTFTVGRRTVVLSSELSLRATDIGP
jgi:hypothetical protein